MFYFKYYDTYIIYVIICMNYFNNKWIYKINWIFTMLNWKKNIYVDSRKKNQ